MAPARCAGQLKGCDTPMTAFWTEPDFDDLELVQVVHERQSGLTAIIAVHSSHLGPGAGGTRFWHYHDPQGALRDALLLRGLSIRPLLAVVHRFMAADALR